MSHTADNKLKRGMSFPFSHLSELVGVVPNFFLENGHCEMKPDFDLSKLKVKDQSSPLTIASTLNSFVAKLISGIHFQKMICIPTKLIFNGIPQSTSGGAASLLQKYPPFKDLDESYLKLKGICMLYLPSKINLKDILTKHQDCNASKVYLENDCANDFSNDQWESEKFFVQEPIVKTNKLQGAEPEKLETKLKIEISSVSQSAQDSVEFEFESDEEFCEHQEVHDSSSKSSENEEDEEKDDDDDVDEDFDDWDEDDWRYSSPSTSVSNRSGSSLFAGVDKIFSKWDADVDDELKNVPRMCDSPEILFDSDGEDDNLLMEVNQRWNSYYSSCSKKRRKCSRKVRFQSETKLQTIHRWDDSEGSRCGPWQQYALDSARFKRRIEECEKLLDRILQPDHRSKIFSTSKWLSYYDLLIVEIRVN